MKMVCKFVYFNGKEKPHTKSKFYEIVIFNSAACSLPLEQFREEIQSLDAAGSSEPNVSRLFVLARRPSYTLAEMSLVQANGRVAERVIFFRGTFFFSFSFMLFPRLFRFLFLFFL